MTPAALEQQQTEWSGMRKLLSLAEQFIIHFLLEQICSNYYSQVLIVCMTHRAMNEWRGLRTLSHTRGPKYSSSKVQKTSKETKLLARRRKKTATMLPLLVW